mmetsp:Transcript_58955/g.104770  ORF Transcript_58955/g.104770 Transcript_58955/m.104770 type:complete len:294 (+) Transcript_58955:52-933(+)
MAPKAAPEPTPEVAEDEGANEYRGPKLFGMQISEEKIRLAGGLEADSQDNLIRKRNAYLDQDEKLHEVRRVIQDPKWDSTSASDAGNRWRGRTQGTEVSEKLVRALSPTRRMGEDQEDFQFRAASPGGASLRESSSTLTLAASSSMTSLGSKPGGRSSTSSLSLAGSSSVDTAGMTRSMTRMMQDMELAQVDPLTKSAPRLRTAQLDKMHSWLQTHRPKERKPKSTAPSPGFLTFTKDDRVMTGSMRSEPDERRYQPLPWDTVKQTPGWLAQNLYPPDAPPPPAQPASMPASP